MKKGHIILLCILLAKAATGQPVDTLSVARKLPAISNLVENFCGAKDAEILYVESANRAVSSGSYKRYVDQYFTYLSYNRGVLPTGTSASLELADKETQLNLNVSRKAEGKRGGLLLMTAGVIAKLDNNVSQLFNGSTPQSGTSFFGNFAFMPAKAHLKYATNIINEDGELTDVLADINRKRRQFKDAFCYKYGVEYVKKYSCLIERWVELDKISVDSITCKEALPIIKEKEAIEKSLKDAGLLDKNAEKISREIFDEYKNQMYELEIEDESWISVRFFWFSGGIIYTRESYDTYNNNELLAKRFSTQDFDALGFRISANWFKEKINDPGLVQAQYFNLSYAPARTNNFSGLKSQDVVRIIEKNQNSDTTYAFQATRKAKDITGKSYETNWKHVFSTTYTAMFGENKGTGINLQGQLVVSPISKPIYSTHLGILLRLLNNNYDPTDKKSKAKINFEVFVELPDMTDVAGSNKSMLENSVIGINTSVPFNKIFFK